MPNNNVIKVTVTNIKSNSFNLSFITKMLGIGRFYNLAFLLIQAAQQKS